MKSLDLSKMLMDELPLALKKFYHDMKPEGVTLHKFRLLMMLKHHPGHPMKFYAKRIGIKKSNFSVLIDEAIELNWVERKQSTEDRRKVILELTAIGESYYKEKWDELKYSVAESLEILDDAELDRLTQAVSDMIYFFDKVNKERV